MHTVVSCSEGTTTSCPVTKSIRHLLKAWPITHISFVTNPVQGPTLEIVHREKRLSVEDVTARNTPPHRQHTDELLRLVPGSTPPLFLPHTPVLTASADCSAETSACCSAACLLLLGELLKCCSERASKTQCTDVAKTQNKSRRTHSDTRGPLQYEAFF